MKKLGIYSFFIIVLLILGMTAANETNSSNSTFEYSKNISENSSIENTSDKSASNYTGKIKILDIIPKNFNLGDVTFNIRIQNNHTAVINNIFPIIFGKGFSTYEVIPVDSLQPGEKDYLIVSGNFKERGTITLTIKIDGEVFYQDVMVENPDEKTADKEESKKEILENLSLQLSDLKQGYSELESEYFDKKDNEYDLSQVNLNDLKSYIRNIETDIINENIKSSTAEIKLAYESYEDQKKKIENSKQKSSILLKLKDNALIFSTIAGAFITLFALSEILKKKSSGFVGTIKKVSYSRKKN